MRCPNDSSTLVERDYGVTVHECDQCSGLWFERDELRRAKDSSDPELRWLDFDVFAAAAGASEGSRQCPICSKPMRTLEYMHSKVQVDVCDREDQVRGAWLDAGAFQKIMGYLEEVADSMDVDELRKAAASEAREVGTGDESLLSEVKDLLATLRLLRLRASVEHPTSESTLARLSHLLP